MKLSDKLRNLETSMVAAVLMLTVGTVGTVVKPSTDTLAIAAAGTWMSVQEVKRHKLSKGISDRLRKETEPLQTQIADLASYQQTLENAKTHVESELQRLKEESKAAYERYLGELKERDQENATLTEALKNAETQVAQELEPLQNSQRELSSRLEKLQEELETVKTQKETLEKDLAKAQADSLLLLNQCTAYETLVAELREQEKTLEERIHNLTGENQSLEKVNRKLVGVSASLQAPKTLRGSSRAVLNCNRVVKYLQALDIIVDAEAAESKGGSDIIWIDTRKDKPEEVKKYLETLQTKMGLLSVPRYETDRKGIKLTLEVEDELEVVKQVPEVPSFDLMKLKDRNAYPVIFVSGGQGASKTTAARYLGAVLKDGKRWVVSPHLDSAEFPGYDGYFGAGSRHLDEGEELPEGAPLVDVVMNAKGREWSVYAALHCSWKLVEKRLKDYSRGVRDFEPLDIFVDEVPTIRSFFSSKRCPKELKDYWAEWLKMMMTEPRKVGVRAWVLTQSPTITSIGGQGMASLKDESTWLRLGQSALKYAEDRGLPKNVRDRLKTLHDAWAATEERWDLAPAALLNDVWLPLPTLGEMLKVAAGPTGTTTVDDASNALEGVAVADETQRILEAASEGLKTNQIIQAVYGLKPSRSKEYVEAKNKVNNLVTQTR